MGEKVQKDMCPECGGEDIVDDYDIGETSCGECGLVIKEDMVNTGPEWRAYTKAEKQSRSRVGIPFSYYFHDKGLSTIIGRNNRDSSGRILPTDMRYKMWRLRRQQNKYNTNSSLDRNLSQAMTELDRLSNKLSISSPVKERAALIYRKSLNEDLVRGRSIAAIIAASLYIACRAMLIPRSLKEVSESSLAERKEVSRCYRLILRKLDLKMPIHSPMTYLAKISERANISGKAQSEAKKIIKEAKSRRISAGKDPTGLAAAALYIACMNVGEKKTQKDIAEASGVTEVTVRNRYKNLRMQLASSNIAEAQYDISSNMDGMHMHRSQIIHPNATKND